MRRSRPRGRIGGLRAQLLFGLVVLLVLTLALVALATTQFHRGDLQQAVAQEALRHAEMLATLDGEADAGATAAALEAQPGVLHAGSVPEGISIDESVGRRAWIADFDGQPAMWAMADEGPHTLVVLSLDDAQAAIDDGRRVLTLYLAMTLLVLTLFGYAFFSFVVIRPLRALSVATERAADGDLASPITVLPRNEFGDVGRQFNAMLERLDDQRQELEEQLEKLRQAHEQLQHTQESLIRSEKMASVGHLAAGVAHEVGNPLAAVMGYTELLRDRSLQEEEADDVADRILVQLKRIRRIIRQLLDYSRIESERSPTSVDLSKVIDEASHLVRATSEGSDTDFDIHLSSDLPAVRAVPGELEQVMVNLFLNALEAMAEADTEEPKLIVRADSDDEGRVVVDIRDSGPGIDPHIADQIFDPFFTTREPGKGTGLGLAIAQRLVSRSSGELRLMPSEEGAHFRILLHRAD